MIYKNLILRLLAVPVLVSFLDIHLVLAQKQTQNHIKRLYEGKNYQKIIDDLSPKLAELSKSEIIYLGKSYSELKNPIAALKVFNVGSTKLPNDIELKSLIGYELFKSKNDKEAIRTLKEVIELDKKYEPAYKYLVEIFQSKKNIYELRLLYQDMLDNIGEKYEYFLKLCEISRNAGLHDLSKKYCNRCVELNPRKADCYVYLGLSQKDAGQIDEAKKNLKMAADSFSKSEFAQSSYGQVMLEQKSFVDAYKYFQRSITINPNSLIGLVGLGTSGVEIQKFDESLKAFSKACKIDKSTLLEFRKALSTIRLMKNDTWQSRFEIAISKCQ